MKLSAAASPHKASIPAPTARVAPPAPPTRLAALRLGAIAACAAALAGCAGQTVQGPGKPGAGGRYFDPVLGVWASPRVVDDGQAVPRGGGGFLVGRPYTIGGHLYVPNADPRGYSAAGTASWYGDAFHGRRTANGEIFDKGSISAAHPTLPLPSYVRVTNLKNGRSMIVRVNDRGPYHGGRVMDVSQRVAEALAFRNEGTGHVRIDYVGRAGLAGVDDDRLLASLTTDGRPARLDGLAEPVPVADAALPPRPTGPSPLPNIPARVASLPIFRRGHAVGDVPAPAPVEPLPAAAQSPPPGRSRPLRARPGQGTAIAADRAPTISAIERDPPPGSGLAARPDRTRPAGPGARRDPFYRPLFPPPKPDLAPRASISFGGPARDPEPAADGRGARPRRPAGRIDGGDDAR